MSKPLVLYHDHCQDGFASAWVAQLVFGDNADYVPVSYGNPPPDVTGRRDVYILDFSYQIDVLSGILNAVDAGSVTVLDHHKTAITDMNLDVADTFGEKYDVIVPVSITGSVLKIKLNVNKCGARLAWEHFFPEKKCPWIIDYVEDRDLWKWELPRSRQINAAMASYPFDFELWSTWAGRDYFSSLKSWLGYKMDDTAISIGFYKNRLAEEGASILRYLDKLVQSICQQAYPMVINGHKVRVVNTSVLAYRMLKR